MRMVDLIEKKRNGGCLTPEEIAFFVEGITHEKIPDYQATALMMAVYFRGLSREETVSLTREMAHSGGRADLSACGGVTVDKHSTGGVGDKTTLIVAPIAAALGCKVAKMSGRGLGHTGGTVDKLESIPGFRTTLSPKEFLEQVRKIGLCVVGQSGNFAPADKKLYALRDVTATVDETSLIAASIMSKKLAAGADCIVLDVKTGSGAFMKTPSQAKELARIMVEIGKAEGRRMKALITNMDIPLGRSIGNALEIQEAIQILRMEGPKDLTDLCVALSSHMVQLGTGQPLEECEAQVQRVLANGKALEKLKEMVEAQGGDPTCIHQPSRLPRALHTASVLAPKNGFITAMDSKEIGVAAGLLGAGRLTAEDAIQPAAGITLIKTVGDAVRQGEPIATLHFDEEHRFSAAQTQFLSALSIEDTAPVPQPLIYEVL